MAFPTRTAASISLIDVVPLPFILRSLSCRDEEVRAFMNDNDKQPGPDNGGNGNPWMKSLLIWVGILMGLALFVSLFPSSGGQNAGTSIPYSAFLDRVEEGSVKDVNVAANVITGTQSNGEKFRTYAMNDPQLTERLRKAGVSITARPEEGPSIWQYMLVQALPFLLFLGIAFFVVRQMQKGGGANGAMGFGKSRARMLTQKEGKVTFDDVAGIDEAREELEEIVEFLKDPTKFARLGGKIPKGALLVGSPGTGKTLLARAIAGEAGVPFFTISGSDFVEMFVGVGASRVRDMFEQAKKSAPCIVFIDEIDAVGRHRGAGLGNGNDEREQTLNQLLVEMDGFEANEGIIIIAATNRPDVLDPALLRPGRFDRQVVVPRPDIEGRIKILQVHMKKVPLAPDVDARTIARGTPGFSGADLANLVNEAALTAARKGKRLVAMLEFEEAKDKVMMGAERRSMVMTDDEKRMTAYHEAGHAIVSIHEPASDPIHKATIIPRGRALGMVMRLPERDSYSYHRDKMYANLAVAMGGRIAEEIIFGYDKVSSGASGDIQQATSLARDMVTRWGMSDAVGPVEYAEPQGESFLGYSQSAPARMSNKTAELIDSEIKRIVEGGLTRARDVLTEHVDQLHTLAGALLEYETLSGDEIKRLIAGEDLGRPTDGPTRPVVAAGTSIPKTRRPQGPFGQPSPAGA
jgi:cell division protease FtsH